MPDTCKHLQWILRDMDPIGRVYCPDCHAVVWMSEAINNLADEMRSVLKAAYHLSTHYKVSLNEAGESAVEQTARSLEAAADALRQEIKK